MYVFSALVGLFFIDIAIYIYSNTLILIQFKVILSNNISQPRKSDVDDVPCCCCQLSVSGGGMSMASITAHTQLGRGLLWFI